MHWTHHRFPEARIILLLSWSHVHLAFEMFIGQSEKRGMSWVQITYAGSMCSNFFPLQDMLYIVNNYLLITNQGANCPYFLHTQHRLWTESLWQWGSHIWSWQVVQALPRDRQVILTWKKTTKSKEKLPSTVAVATGIQGQGKCDIIGLPSSAICLPRVCNYQSDCSPGWWAEILQAILSVVMETTAVRPFPFLTMSLKACFHSEATGRLSESSISTQALVESTRFTRSPCKTASCLQCYCRASPLIIVQDQYEVVWHLQAIFSQILTPLRKGLRLDAGPKRHNLSPWGSGPAQRRKVPFCFTVLRSHHYNANLHCTFCLHIFHPPPVVTTQPS